MNFAYGSGFCKHTKLTTLETINVTIICPNNSSHKATSAIGYKCKSCNNEIWREPPNFGHTCISDGYYIAAYLAMKNKPKAGSTVVSDIIPTSSTITSNSARIFEALYGPISCEKCINGKVICSHGFTEEHEYCIHTTDDIDHKWHYSKAK